MVALKRADRDSEVPLAAPTRRAILDALRRIASAPPPELPTALMQGRTVYQDAGAGRIERIERDGNRSIGRIVNRQFVPERPGRASRRK